MSDALSSEAEYRLHWTQPAKKQPGTASHGERVGAWVGSDDPRALKRYADERPWPSDTVLMLTLKEPDKVDFQQVYCSLAEFAAWDVDAAPLPVGAATPTEHRSPSAARHRFFSAVRKSVDDGVEGGVLARDMADALLLAARDAVDETASRKIA